MSRTIVRRLLLVTVVLLGILGSAGAVAAATRKPDFTISSPTPTVTTSAGQVAAFPVKVTRLNGFTKAVSLAVAGAPTASRLTLSPHPNRSSRAATVVSLQTYATARPGTYPLRLTATSGSLTRTMSATLVVTAAAPAGFTISNTPSTVNAPQGTVAVYTIAIARTRFTAPVAFTVTNVPPNATATFTPVSTTGDSTVLQVATTNDTPQGSYGLIVKGTGSTGASTTTSTTTVHLTVSAPKGSGKQFTITGDADRQIAPGVTARFDLAITNPNNQTLAVTALVVTLANTSASACPPSNFAVGQFTGAYPLSVPANSTRTLSQLGVPQDALPTIGLTETGSNQNPCRNIRLTLSYAGSGNGA